MDDANPQGSSPRLKAVRLEKTYRLGERSLTVLQRASFEVAAGEAVAIVGPSGSGKTTLLGLCAGLDVPSSGSVLLAGEALESLSEDERAALRAREVGFVFQNFQLIPTLTALENVSVPLELRGERGAARRAREVLGRVGLGERTGHYPAQLSGGEQQRVALARAFVNEPSILFADEPTGNLDDETSAHIAQMLFDLNTETGTTLVLVTHDLTLARRTGRVLRIRQGQLSEEPAHVTAS